MSVTKPLQTVVLYNVPTLPKEHADYDSETGVLESVRAISTALGTAGHAVTDAAIGNSASSLAQRLEALRPDVIVNLCESFAGDSAGEPHIAALLDMLCIPYTGSPSDCLAITHNKVQTKRLLSGSGIATPEFIEVRRGEVPAESIVRPWLQAGPLIIKPAAEDASLGIGCDSVVTDWPALLKQVATIHECYGHALVERYIAGREFNVGIIELPDLQVLPLAEIVFSVSSELPWPIVTYQGKWSPTSNECLATPVRCPAMVETELEARIRQAATAAYRFTGCHDYARIDLRVDAAGNVFVLEVNANPDVGPNAGLARMLRAAGIEYDDFARRLIETAVNRSAKAEDVLATPRLAACRQAGVKLSPASIRRLAATDRQSLIEITRSTAVFRPDEIAIADEVLRDAQSDGPMGHYQVLVAELDGRIVGWSCHGLVPLTDATFDLYWIVVDPTVQGRGVGRQLLAEVERQVKTIGGSWLLAETSSIAAYKPTHNFYERCGYRIVSQIDDFYRAGDGKLTFGKRFD